MKYIIDFPPVNVINVPCSGIMWDFSCRKNVYYTNGSPTLIIELDKEEFKRIHEIFEGVEIKRIGSYSYEVEFEGRKYLAKIKVDGRDVDVNYSCLRKIFG